MHGRRQMLLVSLLGSVLFLCALAGPAAGQDASQPLDTVSDEQSFDPGLTRAVPETAPVEEPTDEPIDTEDAETDPGNELAAETIETPGWGNAADQSPQAKEEEAEDDCADDARPPNSKLLGLPSTVGGDSDDPLGTLILVIAGGALAVAAVAYRLRSRGGAKAPRGSLELVATLVGILGGIAGLAVQFVPGVGVHDAPTPTATMAVRDINTRITHGEYARKTNGRMPQGEDRREVGNVIWLEVRLEGYADKLPVLQYASYNTDRGQLLPGTAAQVPLPDGDADVETHFVPIWIGYPLSERFEAGFRLLDGNRVQAVAETGRMKASKYRYACPS